MHSKNEHIDEPEGPGMAVPNSIDTVPLAVTVAVTALQVPRTAKKTANATAVGLEAIMVVG